MSQNKQRLSWLEMLKVNQRAYLLFYKRYPRMILSRFALIIWKALTPYVGIYFSALIIEELAGAKNPWTDSFSGASYLIFDSCRQPCNGSPGKMEERSKRWNVAEDQENFVREAV